VRWWEQKSPEAQTSVMSMLFEPPSVSSDTFDWHQLPKLKPDGTDPVRLALHHRPARPGAAAVGTRQRAAGSTEVLLAKCQAALEMDNHRLLKQYVNEILAADPWEWRAVWVTRHGVAPRRRLAHRTVELQRGLRAGARRAGAKLALAVACGRAANRPWRRTSTSSVRPPTRTT
jgi:serine/threonine-protein kinase PknG